jgi:hypothetical protein
MTNNPYKEQPNIAFWSRSVSENFYPIELVENQGLLFKNGDSVTSAGSCFASNLVPYIEKAGLHYIRTEAMPKIFSELGENLGYANFSAAYGNIYTARQLLQLYKRTLKYFSPIEDRWIGSSELIDPFRPGLKFPSSTHEEFDLQTKLHLKATREAFETADVFVFTLGLTESWAHKSDGAIYPACPGTIAGNFDPKLYEFKNFNTDEIVQDLSEFIDLLRNRNPKVRFIISVSPVPLVATGTKSHVLTSTIYSKSVLRVAAEELATNLKDVTYFPAYEIITGPQAPHNFFEEDRRNVSENGVRVVMETLLQASGLQQISSGTSQKSTNIDEISAEQISNRIATIECDEVMLDENLN